MSTSAATTLILISADFFTVVATSEKSWKKDRMRATRGTAYLINLTNAENNCSMADI
jgi:hypothetical protein